ncbi:TetR/AcrR family transcriptional regulator [Kutzneria sp. 744]|uniref:TetR/AcrR family transcriptional regulator n=1 Tax=Kutzneria sp. (strain 744) TaxID=345341 RepID=UPI0003EEA6B6|nr:TetR/AcrR family transcriptional regulator [Kutzneria sp. 744]EWM18571.1 TetR-family transcriptional regulator [Kutzneria sp. 744]
MARALEGREAASMERRRRRIVGAATELLAERGVEGLSADDVAARAEVSRRTVFNYFHSTEELLIAVGTEMLGDVIDSLTVGDGPAPTGGSAHEALLDDVVTMLGSIDLLGAMIRLTLVLGPMGHQDTRVLAIVRDTVFSVSENLMATARHRHPDVPPLDVELLVSSLLGGLMVLQKHWTERAGLEDSPQTRRLWSELFDRLVLQVRAGFLALG